jgi:hypothetical protein
MTEAQIQRLLAERKIEQVDPDPETARQEVDTAQRHIAAAREIAELDPTLAFIGLYDAIRKAIQAHMRAGGYRVTRGPGAHVKIGEYARAALDELDIEDVLDEFDALRILRNQSEYEALFVQADDVERALGAARALVEAVARILRE